MQGDDKVGLRLHCSTGDFFDAPGDFFDTT
jgi:hypothetical protein